MCFLYSFQCEDTHGAPDSMNPSGGGAVFLIMSMSAYDVQCKPKKDISVCISSLKLVPVP